MFKWFSDFLAANEVKVARDKEEVVFDDYSPPVNNILRAINNRWHTFCLLGITEQKDSSNIHWSERKNNYLYKDTRTGVIFNVTRKWTNPTYWYKKDNSDRHNWKVSCNVCSVDWDESEAIGQEIGKRIMARSDSIQKAYLAKENKKWAHKQKLNEIKRNHVVDLYAGEK